MWHAHLPSLRELRVRLRVLVVTSSESLSTAGLSRCPRTVLKAQLLLFATCKGEANALRKSRLRYELLLWGRHSCASSDGRQQGDHGDEVQLVQAEQADAALVVGVFDGLPQRCILLVRGVRARRGGVAREARAESRPTNQRVAGCALQVRLQSNCMTCIQKRIRSAVATKENGS